MTGKRKLNMSLKETAKGERGKEKKRQGEAEED